MISKPYKDYDRILCSMPDMPEVLKVVDTMHGVIYINKDAAPDAKIIKYLTEYGTQFCFGTS